MSERPTDEGTAYALDVRGLGKRYKLFRSPTDKVLDALGVAPLVWWRKDRTQDFWALRGLDLRIPVGQRVGIIGHNGAGKSTLLKIICGSITPTEGTVDVRGKVQALLDLGGGFHPEFTGRQNIRAALSIQGFSARRIAELEEEIVDFAELDDFIDQPIKTYSAGMYARLAFTTSTVVEPEILIIDEVLGAGDAYFAGKCFERMRRLTEDSGATVLFVSHDIGSVQRLCNRVVWMQRGQVVADGDPLDVSKRYGEHVREQQELRLRARELRLRKKQVAHLDAETDVYRRVLFHLIADTPNPTRSHRIRRLGLTFGDGGTAEIDVGAPMDNAAGELHALIDTPGYMDWGPAARDAAGTYRAYEDRRGRYHHAPFEFSIPHTALDASRACTLTVEADLTAGEAVHVDVHDGAAYRRLGTLADGTSTFRFELAAEGAAAGADDAGAVLLEAEGGPEPASVTGGDRQQDAADTPVRPDTEYGDRTIEIVRVALVGSSGREGRVFEPGERVVVRFEYRAHEAVPEATFVFCVYLPDGQVGTQVWTDEGYFGRVDGPGRGVVEFVFDSLTLGQSAYYASAAAFHTLSRDGSEAPAAHVWDRCVHFEVKQPPSQPIARGLVVQDPRVTVEHRRSPAPSESP